MSPKYVEKASRSPYISKRVQKVTSWISRISILLSLLSQGINRAVLTTRRGLLSKRRSVDRCAHTCSGSRRGRQYPRCRRSKLLLATSPHCLSAGNLAVFSTRSVSIRKLGIFGPEAGIGMRHVGGQNKVLNSVKQVLNSANLW